MWDPRPHVLEELVMSTCRGAGAADSIGGGAVSSRMERVNSALQQTQAIALGRSFLQQTQARWGVSAIGSAGDCSGVQIPGGLVPLVGRPRDGSRLSVKQPGIGRMCQEPRNIAMRNSFIGRGICRDERSASRDSPCPVADCTAKTPGAATGPSHPLEKRSASAGETLVVTTPRARDLCGLQGTNPLTYQHMRSGPPATGPQHVVPRQLLPGSRHPLTSFGPPAGGAGYDHLLHSKPSLSLAGPAPVADALLCAKGGPGRPRGSVERPTEPMVGRRSPDEGAHESYQPNTAALCRQYASSAANIGLGKEQGAFYAGEGNTLVAQSLELSVQCAQAPPTPIDTRGAHGSLTWRTPQTVLEAPAMQFDWGSLGRPSWPLRTDGLVYSHPQAPVPPEPGSVREEGRRGLVRGVDPTFCLT